MIRLFALILVLTACHQAKPPARPTVPPPCDGMNAVRVHNASGAPIDVYLVTGGRNPRILGTAPVGGAQFTLPLIPPGQYPSFRARSPSGQWLASAFGNRARTSRITYDLICL